VRRRGRGVEVTGERVQQQQQHLFVTCSRGTVPSDISRASLSVCCCCSQNSQLSAEEFHRRLQEATNFPLRPFVVPFLKVCILLPSVIFYHALSEPLSHLFFFCFMFLHLANTTSRRMRA